MKKLLLKFFIDLILLTTVLSLLIISPLRKRAFSDLKAFATEDGSPDWFNLSQPMLAPTKAVIEWLYGKNRNLH